MSARNEIIKKIEEAYEGYRDAFLYHVTPPLTDFIYVSVIACIVLVLGYMIFKKLEKGFAEQF